ncbi:uncharacterized protein TNCV_595791 [Trichonephila clavipes]|uniref:Uncharacterized protein n=1 Tax=Trichonephila clavipes TaxID=2585209 RepID=A0A8X6R328_TRICX|nr:uncharacterized protein TNCV_595791 [Trichonephila clavipes]
MEFLKNRKDFFKDLRLDTALNEMLCDAREFADEIDIPANFELIQPRHRVRRRNVNFDYEALENPIEDPTLKYKAEFYFFTLDKAINALESRAAFYLFAQGGETASAGPAEKYENYNFYKRKLLIDKGFEIKETNAVSVKEKVLLSLTSKLSSVEDVNVCVNKKKEKTDNEEDIYWKMTSDNSLKCLKSLTYF